MKIFIWADNAPSKCLDHLKKQSKQANKTNTRHEKLSSEFLVKVAQEAPKTL